MTPEFWAIIAVGVSLGALNVATLQMINKRIDDTNKRIDDTNKRIDGLTSELRELTARVTELEKAQARLAGVLDGLREALFARSREGAGSSSR